MALATSPTHSCALRKAGLYCWGENFLGQLANGDITSSDTPVAALEAGTDIVELALATGRTCVRRSTGEVACWGANEYGQIGNGTRLDSLTAAAAIGIRDARAMAVDDTTTCVVRTGGTVSCWGGAPLSSLEDGSVSPVRLEGLDGAVELRPGLLGDYCARGGSGWVRCWSLEDGTWSSRARARS